ncbi:unnamed protein product [Ilex paraguariensis]|uniref:WAT1-related protein n=1 Tax=Ilex paraguariensis TaxID=185542 RepID=A0ABC8T413_9AQUA
MGRGRKFYREVLPFAAVIISQCSHVGLGTAFKAAALQGMSYRVFIVYSNALAGLVLLPFALIFDRFLGQTLGYMGLDYSSPILASIISSLTPAFTFAFAIIFRMEKVVLRSFSSQVKIAGSIVSISGAIVVVLYKGPTIIKTSSPSKLFYQPGSSQSDWIIGGILFAVADLVISIWYIAQAQTVKKYPAEQLITSMYNLVVATIALPVAYILEPNGSTWEISTRMMMIAILIAGLFTASFGTAMLTWSLRMKGPVYVALFTPLSIVTTVIMSVIFLGDSLYLGSVVGAIIVSFGFYVSLWGKAKEETADLGDSSSLESQSPENVPILQ